MTVFVPAEAKVYINGIETRSKGSERQYVSFGLAGGKTYPYIVSALMLVKKPEAAEAAPGSEDREWKWQTRTVYLKAGERAGVTFSDDPAIEKQLADIEAGRAYHKERALRENVPAAQQQLRQQMEKASERDWTASTR